VTAAVALALQAGAAHAQAPAVPGSSEAPGDASVQLFREGRTLLNKGRFAEACEKFSASLELRRSPGTLLNVGNCIQSSGNLTGALQVLEEALALAQSDPDPQKAEAWAAAAREEIADMERRIPQVLVNRPLAAEVRVALDGRELTLFREPVRLNPGPHRLVASAEGKVSFERSFDLVEGQTQAIELPELAAKPAPPAPPAATAAATARSETSGMSENETSKVPLWIAGIGGVVLLGGAITGGVAAKQASDLKHECPNHLCEGDLSLPESAHRTAVAADVLMAVGAAGVLVGVTWLLLGDDSDAPALAATCAPEGCSASVRGSF